MHDKFKREILLKIGGYFEIKQAMEPAFRAGTTYIPAAKQVLDAKDLISLGDTILDCQFASGPKTKAFEFALGKEWFPLCSTPLLVNSGSSANLVAISSLGSPLLQRFGMKPLQTGDEVITVAAGFPTTVGPIIQNGWIPVFVDVDLKNLNSTVESVKAAQTDKTRAVVLAHTLGNPYRADKLSTWCKENHIFLIEDCCDAIGATINGVNVGSFGDISTLSFYPAHHISMGEGGAVIARNARVKRIAASFRDWGRDCWCEPAKDNTCGKRFQWRMGELPFGYDHKYIYTHIGYNLKATEMQASLGLSQLEKLPSFIQKRRQNWRDIYQGIKSSLLKDYITPVEPTLGTQPSWFGFPMHCNNGIDRHKLTQFLEEKKVGTRLLFGGNLTKHPAYARAEYRIHNNLKNTDLIMDRTFWIGVHPGIGPKQSEYMLEMLEAGVKKQI